MTSPPPENRETHDLSLEVSSPTAVEVMQEVLRGLTEENITRISLEVESTEPINPLSNSLDAGAVTAPNITQSTSDPTESASTTEQTTTKAGASAKALKKQPSETDEDTESTEEYTCSDCGETFDAERQLAGHRSWCLRDDEQEADTEGLSEDVSIKPGTWKYKVSSAVKRTDMPTTPGELEQRLAETPWAHEKKHLSTILRNLTDNGIAKREEREREGPGTNPFEYWLTEEGEEFIDEIEELAQEDNIPTFEEIVGDTSEGDDSGGGEPTSSVDVSAGSETFQIASVLYHASKPIVPQTIEERVEETAWEMDQSNISDLLDEMHDSGLVTRFERSSERGSPLEYELTDEGLDETEDAIETATGNNYTTFEEIIEGK